MAETTSVVAVQIGKADGGSVVDMWVRQGKRIDLLTIPTRALTGRVLDMFLELDILDGMWLWHDEYIDEYLLARDPGVMRRVEGHCWIYQGRIVNGQIVDVVITDQPTFDAVFHGRKVL